MIDGGIIMQPWQVVAIVTIYDIAKSLFTEYLNWKNETVEDEDDSETEEIDDVLDKLIAEIEQLPTKTRTNWDGCCPDIDYPEIEYIDVTKKKLLDIVGKYKKSEE